MKSIATLITILFNAPTISWQKTAPSQPYSPIYYLANSKNQKSISLAWLVRGSALVIRGLLTGKRKKSLFDDAATGAIIRGIEVISSIGSIPLFLALAGDKEKQHLRHI